MAAASITTADEQLAITLTVLYTFFSSDGSKDTIVTNHTYNAQQIAWFRAGSALNLIKQQQ